MLMYTCIHVFQILTVIVVYPAVTEAVLGVPGVSAITADMRGAPAVADVTVHTASPLVTTHISDDASVGDVMIDVRTAAALVSTSIRSHTARVVDVITASLVVDVSTDI